MSKATTLYMFAIMPPSDLASKIHTKRVEFFEKYKFRKALKPPVHITFYDPFPMQEEQAPQFEDAISKIQKWADQQPSFQIDLRNYNFFENPKSPVIYIDVPRNKTLTVLHSKFLKELTKYLATPDEHSKYKPHVTIGYRDVNPDAFSSIKKYYSKQTFSDSFACNSFCLWKHNGENWQVLKTFHLNGKVTQLTLF
jgi:2'-5' RNA ligase